MNFIFLVFDKKKKKKTGSCQPICGIIIANKSFSSAKAALVCSFRASGKNRRHLGCRNVMRSRGCAVQNKTIYLNKRNQLSTLPTVAQWITRNQTRNARPLRPCSNMGYYFTSKYGQNRGLEEFTTTFRGIMNLLPSQPRFLARLPRWQQTPMKY